MTRILSADMDVVKNCSLKCKRKRKRIRIRKRGKMDEEKKELEKK